MKQTSLSFGVARKKAADGNATRRKRRRTGRQTLNYILIFLVAAAIMAVLSTTVLFNIEQIEVSGNTKYAAQALVETSGIKKGDNLLRASEKHANKRLTEKYSYIQSVALKRHFPAKLELAITEETPLGAVDTAAGYVVIGKTGKVLETGAADLPSGLMVVTGMYLYDPKPGQMLGVYPKEQKEHAELEFDGFKRLDYLVSAVAKTGFEKITLIDFTDRLNMMLVYDNRIIVELGVESDLEYKLRSVDKLIKNELPESFEGILDAANAPTTRRFLTDPCNVQEELDRRNLTAEAKARKAQETAANPAAAGAVPGGAPATGLKPAVASSPDASSSHVGYAPGDLDVIPGTGNAASETEDVSSSEGGDVQASSSGG